MYPCFNSFILDKVGTLTSETRKSPSRVMPVGSEKVTTCLVCSVCIVLGVVVPVESVLSEVLGGIKFGGRKELCSPVMSISMLGRTTSTSGAVYVVLARLEPTIAGFKCSRSAN